MLIKIAAPLVPMGTEALRHKLEKKWVHNDVVGHSLGKKVNVVVDERVRGNKSHPQVPLSS